MNWRLKAFIQNAVDRLPPGLSYPIYYRIQRTAGALRRSDPFPDLRKAADIAGAILRHGGKLVGSTVLEVGTGHTLNVPIGLYLCGVEKTITVDLNRYLRPEIVHESLQAMKTHPDGV